MESLVRISNNWALWPFRQLFTCAVERFYQTVLGKIVNNLLSRTLPLFPEVEEWGLRTMNMITYLKVYTKLRWNEGRFIAYFTCLLHSIPCAEFDLSITKGKRTYWGCTWLLTKLVKSCPLSLVLSILLKDKNVVLFQDMCACYSENRSRLYICLTLWL